MKKTLLTAIAICILFTAAASAAGGRVDYIGSDGRCVVYGDYTRDYASGERVQVTRGGRMVAIAVVGDLYPSYMMVSVVSAADGTQIQPGDEVKKMSATSGGGGSKPAASGGAVKAAAIDKIDVDGGFICYGDLESAGFKKGVLVEISRDGRVIAAAEVVEAGAHLSRLTLIGTAGDTPAQSDSVGVPIEIIAESIALEQSMRGTPLPTGGTMVKPPPREDDGNFTVETNWERRGDEQAETRSDDKTKEEDDLERKLFENSKQ